MLRFVGTLGCSVLGRRCGGSTGTNLWGCLQLLQEMRTRGRNGSIVTLLCDAGERHADTYYDDAWIRRNQLDVERYECEIRVLLRSGG